MTKRFAASTFQLTNPQEVQATLTLTLTLEDWGQVLSDLRKGAQTPFWIQRAVQEMLEGAMRHFTTTNFDGQTEQEEP